MLTVSCFWFSGILSGFEVSGSVTSTPFCNMGVTTMKMINSTKQTSTRGVMLMSPRTALTRLGLLCLGSMLAPLALHEEVDQLGGGLLHLDLKTLQHVGEVVEHPGRRDGHAETEGGGDERLRDTGRDGADTTGAGERDAVEGVDDADHGAEQTDEGGDGGDGRQRADAALEVRGGQQRGALDGAGGGFDDLDLGQRAGLALVLERLQAGRDDAGQMALGVLHGGVDGGLRAVVLEVLGRLLGEQERLPAGLAEHDQPLDGDVERPDRQDDQDEDDPLVEDGHLFPDGKRIHFHALLLFSESLGAHCTWKLTVST